MYTIILGILQDSYKKLEQGYLKAFEANYQNS